MDTFDAFALVWSCVLLTIVCFNALALHRLTKMREEE